MATALSLNVRLPAEVTRTPALQSPAVASDFDFQQLFNSSGLTPTLTPTYSTSFAFASGESYFRPITSGRTASSSSLPNANATFATTANSHSSSLASAVIVADDVKLENSNTTPASNVADEDNNDDASSDVADLIMYAPTIAADAAAPEEDTANAAMLVDCRNSAAATKQAKETASVSGDSDEDETGSTHTSGDDDDDGLDEDDDDEDEDDDDDVHHSTDDDQAGSHPSRSHAAGHKASRKVKREDNDGEYVEGRATRGQQRKRRPSVALLDATSAAAGKGSRAPGRAGSKRTQHASPTHHAEAGSDADDAVTALLSQSASSRRGAGKGRGSRSRPKTKEELEARRLRMLARQEKNRQAAKKCRERKQIYYAELEAEVERLRADNERMAKQLARFTEGYSMY